MFVRLVSENCFSSASLSLFNLNSRVHFDLALSIASIPPWQWCVTISFHYPLFLFFFFSASSQRSTSESNRVHSACWGIDEGISRPQYKDMRLIEVPICHSHLLTGRRSAPDSNARRFKRQVGWVAGPREMTSPRPHHTLAELMTRARGMENVASDERAQPPKDIESVPPRYNNMRYRATLENTRDQINGQETQQTQRLR